MASFDEASRAKAPVRKAIEALASVAGVGISKEGQSYVVKVNLLEAPASELPSAIEGVGVVYDVVGRISPRDTAASVQEG